MKLVFRSIYLSFAFLLAAQIFSSYSSNPPNGYTGAPGEGTCQTCHSSGNPHGLDGEVILRGLPDTIEAEITYQLTVAVTNPNALSLQAGFQMVAIGADGTDAGTLDNPSDLSTLTYVSFRDRTYFEHFPARTYNQDREAIWTVDWTAPAASSMTDTVAFYVVGNITDTFPFSNTGSDLIVTNDYQTVLLPAPAALPDLNLSNLEGWSGTAEPEDVVNFEIDLNNLGSVTADGTYTIKFFLSGDTNFDSGDAEAGLIPTGNTPPGTIADVPAAITVPAGLSSGDYFLIAVVDVDDEIEEENEDNNVLVSSGTLTVQSNEPAIFTTFGNSVSCFDGSDGKLGVEISGGDPPYSFAWSNGSTDSVACDLIAGDYSVLIVSSVDDSSVLLLTVLQPEELAVSVSASSVQCPGDATARATATVSGGTPPYTYSWPGGDSTNLAAGTYQLTVTDDNGCFEVADFSVRQRDTQQPNLRLKNITAYLDNDGNVIVSPADFDNGSTDNCGEVIFEDNQLAYDCSQIGSLQVNIVATDASNNVRVGTATLTVQDTTAPIVSCLVDSIPQTCNGFEAEDFFVVSDNCDSVTTSFTIDQGQVIFTAVDASGNVSDPISCNISESGLLSAEVSSVVDPLCNGDANGFIDVNVNGGNAPYRFVWSTGDTTEDVSNLPAGAYEVTIFDVDSCFLTLAANLSEPDTLNVSIDDVTNVSAGNTADGSINITVNGGSQPYSYSWTLDGSEVSTDADPQNLEAGTYLLVVTDANGCVFEADPVEVGMTVSNQEISWMEQVSIYPNPARTFVQVTIPGIYNQSLKIEMYNSQGQQVWTEQRAAAGQGSWIIPLNDREQGIYWLRISDGADQLIRKLIVVP